MQKNTVKVALGNGRRWLASRRARATRLMAVTGTVAIAGLMMFPMTGAQAAVREPGSPTVCPADPHIVVQWTGYVGWASIGAAAGKQAARTGSLSVALHFTQQRSTSWVINGGASLGWGIFQVDAHTSYSVVKTSETGITVIDTILKVPGGYFAYIQPKVEYRNFDIRKEQYNGHCVTIVVKDYGILHAITTYPFYSECVARTPCTPRP